MKTIATTQLNKLYNYRNSLSDMIVEAHYAHGRVIFYETHTKKPDWIVPLNETTVRDLFAVREKNAFKPLLINENRDVWVILNRKHPAYRKRFEAIVKRYVTEELPN